MADLSRGLAGLGEGLANLPQLLMQLRQYQDQQKQQEFDNNLATELFKLKQGNANIGNRANTLQGFQDKMGGVPDGFAGGMGYNMSNQAKGGMPPMQMPYDLGVNAVGVQPQTVFNQPEQSIDDLIKTEKYKQAQITTQKMLSESNSGGSNSGGSDKNDLWQKVFLNRMNDTKPVKVDENNMGMAKYENIPFSIAEARASADSSINNIQPQRQIQNVPFKNANPLYDLLMQGQGGQAQLSAEESEIVNGLKGVDPSQIDWNKMQADYPNLDINKIRGML